MNNEEEIRHRDNIMCRIRNGEKISCEDRLWLVTHRVFNSSLGFPYLNADIIHLCPQTKYNIRVKLEKLSYSQRIIPVFTAPGGKGEIISNAPVVNLKGVEAKKSSIKMLGLLIDLTRDEAEFVYRSNIGLLGVSYECDYFDNKQHLYIRKTSNTGDSNFAMFREDVSENKVRYKCKTPLDDSFENFIFSLEWMPVIF